MRWDPHSFLLKVCFRIHENNLSDNCIFQQLQLFFTVLFRKIFDVLRQAGLFRNNSQSLRTE